MKLVVEPARAPLSGRVAIPGDKSIGHRALLFSLLSATPVRVLGLGDGADNGRSAKAIAALGATVGKDGPALVITGTGLDGMRAPAAPIDCGNSGTTIRLLCGLLAGQRFASTLFGDDSLSKRPMRRVMEPLAQMGAAIAGTGDGMPPLTVGPASGPLRAIDYALPMASAQVKTAVLLAGLYADGATTVTEPGPSRDHSERMLAYLGAPIAVTGRRTTIAARGWDRRLAGNGFEVPADPSSAAFLVAAALVADAGEVVLPGVCVNPTRTGFLDVIAAMGGVVSRANERMAGPEPIADLVVRGAAPELRACEIAGDLAVRSIDELPILAVLAARARHHGRARRRGATRQGERSHRDHVRDAARVRRRVRGAPRRVHGRGPARWPVRGRAGARRRRPPHRDGGRGRRAGRRWRDRHRGCGQCRDELPGISPRR